MYRKFSIKKTGWFLSSVLFFVTQTAFSQSNVDKPTSRSEIFYKQVHGSEQEASNLLADGFKLKMDLSAIEKADAMREIDPNAIPAEDIYGGVWANNSVNAYGDLKNAPDSFIVDLSNFYMPTIGHMTSNFGRRGSRRYHYGVDIKAYTGDTIYAAFDGKIRVKDYEGKGYGNYLVVRHVNGLETVYGHLSRFLVKENQNVRSGQPIGLAGNTGRSTGSHLHFETRFLGKPINPNFIIDFKNQTCIKDEYLVTNSSYRKTNNSSKATVASNSNSNKSSTSEANKYVAGDVQYYRIKSGDTLSAISKKYGISVKSLCNLNNITTRTKLKIGKSIRVS